MADRPDQAPRACQVGNQTTDALFWGRPEDITMPRPYYLATTDKMSDLGGATGAHLPQSSCTVASASPRVPVAILR